MTADEELRRALPIPDEGEGMVSPDWYSGYDQGYRAGHSHARSEPRASKVWQNGYEVTITEGKVEQRPGLDLTGYGSEPRAEGLREAAMRVMLAYKPGVRLGFADPEIVALNRALAATPPAEGLDVERLAREWDALADSTGERVYAGDPAAVIATINTLRACAARLRAALAPEQPDPREKWERLLDADPTSERVADEWAYAPEQPE